MHYFSGANLHEKNLIMTYGICKLAAIALRKENRHTSEMVSQLLYNETYSVLDSTKEWVLVQTDNGPSTHQNALEAEGQEHLGYYQGWIQAKQFCELDEEAFKAMKSTVPYLISKPIVEYDGRLLSLGTPFYAQHPDAVTMPSAFQPRLMIDAAKLLLGVPYLWGGRTAMGIDCSGLTQVCGRMAGVSLPRDASQQVKCGELVYFLQETLPGDLAFFGEEDGVITHAGIVMGDEQIIHASGQVRIDYLDQTGIFNKERNEHTHRLQVVKRLS